MGPCFCVLCNARLTLAFRVFTHRWGEAHFFQGCVSAAFKFPAVSLENCKNILFL